MNIMKPINEKVLRYGILSLLFCLLSSFSFGQEAVSFDFGELQLGKSQMCYMTLPAVPSQTMAYSYFSLRQNGKVSLSFYPQKGFSYIIKIYERYGQKREFPVKRNASIIYYSLLPGGAYAASISCTYTGDSVDVYSAGHLINPRALVSGEYPYDPVESMDTEKEPFYGPDLPSGITFSRSYLREKVFLSYDGQKVIDKLSYFDGLGRPVQTVRKGFTPTGSDLADFIDYSARGLAWRNWLPVPIAGKDGAFVNNLPRKASSITGDTVSYSKTVYERSLLNRPSYTCGAGEGFVGKRSDITYLYNRTDSLTCNKYVLSGDVLSLQGYHPKGSLSVERHTDEDGNINYVFMDMMGRVVLERRMNGDIPYDTYYVYTPGGDLSYVLPPSLSGSTNPVLLNLYAYRYKYDGLHRLVEKKLPGCSPITYFYDKADRIFFSRDGNQAKKGDCLFTLYDSQGREVVKGLCHCPSLSVTEDMLALASFSSTGGTHGTGYLFPFLSGITDIRLLEVTYYDTYDFLSLPLLSACAGPLAYCSEPGYGERYTNVSSAGISAYGRLTGSRTYFPGTDGEVLAAYYYDDRGSVVQSRSTNHFGGYESDFFAYTFSGNPNKHGHLHTAPGKPLQREQYTYEYDHSDRLVSVSHSVNGRSPVGLIQHDYDEFCRLSGTSFHNGAMRVKYAYNIRGWMTGINSDKFKQILSYTDGPGTPRYNGNISSMSWSAGSVSTMKGYTFAYDKLDRLTNAVYGEGSALTSNSNHFTEQVTDYDKMGNILGLKRYGQLSSDSFGLVDNLSFSYTGNQLQQVTDGSTDSVYGNGFEFKDSADLAVEYEYDENGNLRKDLNKKIVDIQYNCLNLPSRIEFENGHVISYLYDADGIKLRTTHIIGSDTTVTDYCGNVIYENGVAKTLLTEVGYITLSDNKYHYYIQDHQGNNRVVIDQDGNVEEVNDYYPFGGLISSSVSNAVQPYKYNGKELDRKNGLDWYDYGARMYDAALGRWHAVDPMSEKYYSWSPYIYCINNPIRYVDPIGMDWYESNNGAILWTDYTSQKELDDNDIRGRYLGQAHVVFSGSRYAKLGIKNGGKGYIDGEGAVTANVTVYGPDGKDDITSLTGFTMTSDVEQYGAISEGLFNANYDSKGKSGALKSNWTLNNRGEIPTMDNEPNLSPYADANYGKPVKTGIFIHSTNNSGYAGKTVSTGCLLLTPQDFRTFNTEMSGVRKFTVRITREQTVKVPLQGVTGIVPNLFIQKTIIRR